MLHQGCVYATKFRVLVACNHRCLTGNCSVIFDSITAVVNPGGNFHCKSPMKFRHYPGDSFRTAVLLSCSTAVLVQHVSQAPTGRAKCPADPHSRTEAAEAQAAVSPLGPLRIIAQISLRTAACHGIVRPSTKLLQ